MENEGLLNEVLYELKNLRDGQALIMNDINTIKAEIIKINNNITCLENQNRKIEVCIENEQSEKFDILFEGNALINEKLDAILGDINDLSSSISATEIVSKVNCREISFLKEKIGVL